MTVDEEMRPLVERLLATLVPMSAIDDETRPTLASLAATLMPSLPTRAPKIET